MQTGANRSSRGAIAFVDVRVLQRGELERVGDDVRAVQVECAEVCAETCANIDRDVT